MGSLLRWGRGTVAAMSLLAVLGVAATGAGASTSPKVVVKPASGLKNGSTVVVSGSGFKPGDTVFIVECLAKASGQSECDVAGIPPAETITSKGVLKAIKVTVVTGKIGNGSCGTKASNLKACAISVGNESGGDTAVAPIAFVLKK